MALTLIIVLVITAIVLLTRGNYIGAIVLAALALPVLAAAILRTQRDQ